MLHVRRKCNVRIDKKKEFIQVAYAISSVVGNNRFAYSQICHISYSPPMNLLVFG